MIQIPENQFCNMMQARIFENIVQHFSKEEEEEEGAPKILLWSDKKIYCNIDPELIQVGTFS